MKPMFSGSEWDVPLIERLWNVIDDIGRNTFGLDYYDPQIEIITAEQMLDCYSSVAMPHMYPHWSFGKTFLQNERQYQKGIQGLAYEVVINTNPCIGYLMESNTATMQALVLAHALCVDEDTECLTEHGWIKISKYSGQKIAQYTESGEMFFERPIKYIKTKTDKFLKIKARGISQKVTPDHTMVFKIKDQLKKQIASEFLDQHLSKTRGHLGKFITHFKYSGAGINLIDNEIRLAIAIKADGSLLNKVNSGHFNCVDYQRVRFHLKKERKINRLCEILRALDIPYIQKDTYGGRIKIVFNVPLNVYTKKYESQWYCATAKQLKLIGEEVLLWDGCVSGNSFSSTKESDADYVQFVWAALGYGTSIYKQTSSGKQDCYNVFRGNYSERSISKSRGGMPNKILESTGGSAYCFTTDTGMWVARRDKNIFVTGNCGHNHFFKNNYLFKNWTDADSIIDYLKFAKKYIKNCEEKHGADKVEKLLDACHALQNHGIDKYKKPSPLSKELKKQRENNWENYFEHTFNDLWRTVPKNPDVSSEKSKDEMEPEENILYFLEKNSPVLKDWEREVVRIVRKISQYFYPQRQTQLLNEGFASFTHHMIMTELHEQGYLTDGSYLEFLQAHTNVVAQRDWDHKYYSGINVYALGFAMLMDVKRMCQTPDKEDRRWFPELCGKPWLETILNIVANYRDESFILQFLSPKVARRFKLFSIHVKERSGHLIVNGTHDDEDFVAVRAALAEQYDLSRAIPQIEITRVDWKGDRWLYMEHITKNNCRLEYKDMKKTVQYVNKLWGFPVKMDYRDLEGNYLEDV